MSAVHMQNRVQKKKIYSPLPVYLQIELEVIISTDIKLKYDLEIVIFGNMWSTLAQVMACCLMASRHNQTKC